MSTIVVLHYLKNINILDHSDPAPICHLKLGCSPIAAYLCLSTQLRRISMLMSLSVFSARLLGASSRHVSLSISHRIFSARPLWARLLGACLWASSLRLSLRLYVLYLRLFAFASAYQLSWRCTCMEFNLGSYCPKIECLSTCVSRQWLLRRSIRPEV